MSDDPKRRCGRPSRYLNGGSNALVRAPSEPGDEQNGGWSREQLLRMHDRTSLPSRQRFARALNPPRRRAHASDLAREIRHQQADVAAERYVITSQNVLAGPQARVSK